MSSLPVLGAFADRVLSRAVALVRARPPRGGDPDEIDAFVERHAARLRAHVAAAIYGRGGVIASQRQSLFVVAATARNVPQTNPTNIARCSAVTVQVPHGGATRSIHTAAPQKSSGNGGIL